MTLENRAPVLTYKCHVRNKLNDMIVQLNVFLYKAVNDSNRSRKSSSQIALLSTALLRTYSYSNDHKPLVKFSFVPWLHRILTFLLLSRSVTENGVYST